MEVKRYKPKLDKLFWWITVPTVVFMVAYTVLSALVPLMLIIAIPIDLFVFYFLISPLFGYVELREDSVFIKFGFFLKRSIPYSKIRGISKERKFYSDSILSLKNSLEHINVKYNLCDFTTVSVEDNDGFCAELMRRCTK